MTRWPVVVLAGFFAVSAGAQDIYDLLLKGGHVVDVKNKRNERLDIAVRDGRIARIGRDIPAAQARRVVDVSSYWVTPGLVDIQARFDGAGGDHNSLRFGVTTAVDAGSSGSKTFEQFRKSVVARSKTRVLAFLNAGDDPEAAARVARQHADTIVGIQAAKTVEPALKAAELSKTIVMADSGLRQMRSGDIYTHIFGRAAPQPADLAEARKKGVVLDVGHGSESFWFRAAAPAVGRGFLPDTLSTGMDGNSLMLPRATMTNVMSKFLALGLTLEQAIERSTLRPARAIRRADVGSLEVGGVADIAVLEVRKGRFAFLDSGRAKLTSDKEVRCLLTVRAGDVVWDSEGLSLTDWREAGPYSNFK